MTNAPINLNGNEYDYFMELFGATSVDGLACSAKSIVPLFQSSGLERKLLKEVWLKSATTSDMLSQKEFWKALLLIALAQNDKPLVAQNLSDPRMKFMPKFTNFNFPNVLAEHNRTLEHNLQNNIYQSYTPSTQSQRTPPRQVSNSRDREESPGIIDRITESATELFNTITTEFGGEPTTDASLFKTQYGDLPGDGADLPNITPDDLKRYEEFMRSTKTEELGVLKGGEAVNVFSSSGLGKTHLGMIWNLADRGQKGMLTSSEFIMAVHLICMTKKQYRMPALLPPYLTQFMMDWEASKTGSQSVVYLAPKEESSQKDAIFPGSQQFSPGPAIVAKKSVPAKIEQLEDFSRDHATVNARGVEMSTDGMDFLSAILDSYDNSSRRYQEESDYFYEEIAKVEAEKKAKQAEICEAFLQVEEQLEKRDTMREKLFDEIRKLMEYVIDDDVRRDCNNLIDELIDETHIYEMKEFILSYNSRLAKSGTFPEAPEPVEPSPAKNDQKFEQLFGMPVQTAPAQAVPAQDPKAEDFDTELSNMFGDGGVQNFDGQMDFF